MRHDHVMMMTLRLGLKLNGGPDCFISCLHVLFTEINQKKKIKSRADIAEPEGPEAER